MGEIKYAYPLIHNKVTSPRYVTPLLRRDRLLDWLSSNSGCRAVVLAADAGYGKTTLLWQWEREVDFPCYWYKLDRNDRDWSLHISYLIEAVAQRHPGFGLRAHSMLMQLGGPGSSRPGVAAFLLAEMHDRLTEPCTFIIDDWQYVASVTEVRGLWNQILRDAPPTCRFIFASRAKPQLQFARFKTHAGYAELRTDELRLTEGEIDELFRDTYGDPLSREELTELERRTEGWAASLQLVEVSLRERQTPEERRAFIESMSHTTDSDLFAFLAEEVLDQQTEETRNFLLSTSILHQITPDLAERLAGAHDGSRQLSSLEHAGLFTYRLDESRYRYHGLFRDFLERRLVAERTDAEVMGLHIHAASYFETTEQWPEAIHHYLRAGLQRQAARLIARYGETVVAEGRIGLVDEWLPQLPQKAITDNARLSLLQGEAFGMRGDWSTAIEALQRARTFFERKRDGRMTALACLKMSSVYHGYGDPLTAAALARTSLDLAPVEDRVLRLRAEGNLAITSGWLNSPVESTVSTLEHIAAQATDAGLGHFAAIGFHNLGPLHRELGNFSQSRVVLERAWRFWRAKGESPFSENTELVLTLLVEGETELAGKVADEGVRGARHWRRPLLEALYGQALVDVHQGRFRDAMTRLTPAVIGLRDVGITTELCCDLVIEAIFLARGSKDEMRSVREVLSRRDRDPRLAPQTHTAMSLAVHYLNECGDDCGQRAAKTLDEFAARGGRFSAALGRIKLATLALEHERLVAGDETLLALGQARGLGVLGYVRWWTRRLLPGLPNLASRPGSGPTLAAVLDADPDSWRVPVTRVLGVIPKDDRALLLSAVERHANREVIEALRESDVQDAATLRRRLIHDRAPRMYIRTFGALTVHRGDWNAPPIPLERKRTRMLLAMLVAYHQRSLSRDELVEYLWPGSDPTSAINSLNQAVFHLRRRFDPRYRDGESPNYVIANAEFVRLNPALVRLDIEEFRRLLARSSPSEGPSGRRHLEAAIDLLRGEFLAEARYEDWASPVVTAIHGEVRNALLAIARGDELADEHGVGLRAAASLARIDTWDEAAQEAMVRRLLLGGQRAAAKIHLESFLRRLDDEFGETSRARFSDIAAQLEVPLPVSQRT